MKLCRACSRVYDDDSLRFCLDDGSSLVDKPVATAAPPTLTLPVPQNQVPTIKQVFEPATAPVYDAHERLAGTALTKKRGAWPWILGTGVLVLLASTIVLGVFVLRPKSALPWHLTLEIDPGTPDTASVVKQTIAVLKQRLDAYGVKDFEVLPKGEGWIVLNLPAGADPERLKHLITQSGKLELVHVVSPPSPQIVQSYSTKEEAVASLPGGTISSNRRVLPYFDREQSGGDQDQKAAKWVVVESPSIVNGSELRDARAVQSPGVADNYQIRFSLNKTGAEKFGAWTAANINEYLGVVLNDEVKSIAYIRSQISDQGEISGRFTKQSAEDLALVLRTGALPAPVKLISETIDKP